MFGSRKEKKDGSLLTRHSSEMSDKVPLPKEDSIPVSKKCNSKPSFIVFCRTLCIVANILVVAAMLALAEKASRKIKLRDSYPDEKSANKHIKQWVKEETSLN